MAPQELITKEISPESQDIIKLIDKNHNFLLSGGAGSGKTYSLVEIIRVILGTRPLAKIACITYTNAAVKEIEDRVGDPNLHVSTIHEFLWGNIKHFQDELKIIIIDLINDDEQSRFRKPDDKEVSSSYFDNLERGIQYKEFVKIKEGIISHDELLIVANEMYGKYKKLCTITKDTYPFIFLDEYQDTDEIVIQILLQFLERSSKKCVIGFFGDAMQSIYEGSIGNLDEYKGDEDNPVKEVKKEQNRRNPKSVIDLANHLRNDGLIQHPSDDISAPNMNLDGSVKNGEVRFLYSVNDNLDKVREYLEWDFTNSEQTKELNLTHNLIAGKAGFEDLMRIYDGDKILDFVRRIKKHIQKYPDLIVTEGKTFEQVINDLQHGKPDKEVKAVLPTKGMQEYINNHQASYKEALLSSYDEISSIYLDKDQLVDDKKNNIEDEGKVGSNRDDLINHLFKIQHNIRLYKENRINEFLRHTDFYISSIDSKKKLKANIESLIDVGEKTIEEVIKEASEYGVAIIDDKLTRFMEKKMYVYKQVGSLSFSQFQNLYRYLEGFTPFSTQHKTKGAEFPNVLIILDNGKWNNYNFENLFTGEGRETVLNRTQKIFYVCCTRVKENLAVFYHDPPPAVQAKAKVWFGDENVIDLDKA